VGEHRYALELRSCFLHSPTGSCLSRSTLSHGSHGSHGCVGLGPVAAVMARCELHPRLHDTSMAAVVGPALLLSCGWAWIPLHLTACCQTQAHAGTRRHSYRHAGRRLSSARSAVPAVDSLPLPAVRLLRLLRRVSEPQRMRRPLHVCSTMRALANSMLLPLRTVGSPKFPYARSSHLRQGPG
jgi:hypothetical protein